MTPPWWLLVVTSAAVGSVSAAMITLLGQALERRARREELLLSRAIDLSLAHAQRVVAVAHDQDRSTTVFPEVMGARDYYEALRGILEHGAIPNHLGAKIEAQNVPIETKLEKQMRVSKEHAETNERLRAEFERKKP